MYIYFLNECEFTGKVSFVLFLLLLYTHIETAENCGGRCLLKVSVLIVCESAGCCVTRLLAVVLMKPEVAMVDVMLNVQINA